MIRLLDVTKSRNDWLEISFSADVRQLDAIADIFPSTESSIDPRTKMITLTCPLQIDKKSGERLSKHRMFELAADIVSKVDKRMGPVDLGLEAVPLVLKFTEGEKPAVEMRLREEYPDPNTELFIPVVKSIAYERMDAAAAKLQQAEIAAGMKVTIKGIKNATAVEYFIRDVNIIGDKPHYCSCEFVARDAVTGESEMALNARATRLANDVADALGIQGPKNRGKPKV